MYNVPGIHAKLRAASRLLDPMNQARIIMVSKSREAARSLILVGSYLNKKNI